MVSNVPTSQPRHRLNSTAERVKSGSLVVHAVVDQKPLAREVERVSSIAQGLAELRLRTARHVLWHYGDENLGVQPGGFMTLILQAFDRADQQNFAKLSDAFPLYGRFVREVKYGDIENVRRIVKEAVR